MHDTINSFTVSYDSFNRSVLYLSWATHCAVSWMYNGLKKQTEEKPTVGPGLT